MAENILSNLSVFQNDGIEIVIDTASGASFCTQTGYARMSGLSQQAVNKRCKGYNQKEFKRAKILSQGGLQAYNLIPAKLAFKWALKDNPELAGKMGEAGATVYFHQLAGYIVTSSAIEKPEPKPQNQTMLSHEAAMLAEIVGRIAGCEPTIIAQLAVNAAIAVNPALTPARDPLKVAIAVTSTEDDALLNATQIGKMLNGLSPVEINEKLIEAGLQYRTEDSKTASKNLPKAIHKWINLDKPNSTV